MNPHTLVKRFMHDGWDVHIYITQASEGFFGGHVDIFSGAVHKCRVVLAGQLDDQNGAIHALELRGKDWIDAWALRDHTGNTGFGDLP